MTNICMVVRDRLKLTEQSIDSLRDHTKAGDYTLTLVDDHSLDFRVGKLLHREAENPDTTVLRISKSAGVVARAKNIAVAWSEQTFGRGDWLYLSDNDVYFKEDWLNILTQAAEETEPKGYRLWGGQLHPFHDQRTGNIKVLDGPSWFMRWRTWEQYGPFQRNTAPGTCQSEEYPICTDLIEDDYQIGVVIPHVVIHTGLTNTKGEKAPGYEERKALMEPGVLYE